MHLPYIFIIFHQIAKAPIVLIASLAIAIVSSQAFASFTTPPMTTSDSKSINLVNEIPQTRQNLVYTGSTTNYPAPAVTCSAGSLAAGANYATFNNSFTYTYSYSSNSPWNTYISGNQTSASYLYAPDMNGVYCVALSSSLAYRYSP